MPRGKKNQQPKDAQGYNHPDTKNKLRPDIGTAPQFNQKKPQAQYRYDSSLSPALDWDNNPAREQAEALIAQILDAESLEDAKTAAAKLKALSSPFLNWTGKAERLSFEVPTLPLFVQERLSTKAIIETLKNHKKGGEQLSLFDLFADSQWSISDQVLKAYEYQDKWVNRMILGDSLVVMNSLLEYEGLGGKVQMIYIDPPYGVKFGSNFQPFVKKRDVKHNDDEDLTREPEIVQAYRDTWELGLHSYLTYLRDRLLLARELLTDSGSVFVQISDENVHHVRELMDDVFGEDNFVSLITFTKTGSLATEGLANVCDYLVCYAKDKSQIKFKTLLVDQTELGISSSYSWIEFPNGERRGLTKEEKENISLIHSSVKFYQPTSLISSGATKTGSFEYLFEGKKYKPPSNSHWKTTRKGLDNLVSSKRVISTTNSLRYIRYLDDFPVAPISNVWTGLGSGSFTEEQLYIVQTVRKVIERCLLMTTEPGDLVLDITCGSGTTAYVAEQWGRRWITCDVSRVPLALARQRLLTATFPYYQLQDESRGPGGGFVYKRKQNKKGEEIGGIVPHITLKSIANNEPPEEEILVDRPETLNNITRVRGPFTIEGTIPPPVHDSEEEEPETEAFAISDIAKSFSDRMLEVLRQSPVLHLPKNEKVTFTNIRQPVKTLSLSAEAMVNDQPVAFVFGPENGAITERLVHESAREAHIKNYTHLYVIGFAIGPNARAFIENCANMGLPPATYIQATPDLLMGDLLKNMRSSQIFSVCGLPEIKIHDTETGKYQVELLGLDVFDPVTMDVNHKSGKDVPAWFLDIDYNGLCFYVCQAFFPKTEAWDSIKKALKGTYDDSVWEHLAGTISTEFQAGENNQIAVKAIDERGNELLVVIAIAKAVKTDH